MTFGFSYFDKLKSVQNVKCNFIRFTHNIIVKTFVLLLNKQLSCIEMSRENWWFIEIHENSKSFVVITVYDSILLSYIVILKCFSTSHSLAANCEVAPI